MLPKIEKSRKSQREIVDGIFKALNDGRTHNADEVARLSRMSWSTVISWLDLVVYIQSFPRVYRERVGRTNLYNIAIEQARRR